MNKKKHGFSLIELLVVLLILGILVGLAVPQYLESRKAARARTFAANVREIIDALEAYKLDNVKGLKGQYPESLADLKSYKYFKQEPINPYTGASMLDGGIDAGITYELTKGKNYIIRVTQSDKDDLDRDTDKNESICIINFVKEMLPNKVCTPAPKPATDFGDLLDGYTYESRIDGFTPRVINISARTMYGYNTQATLMMPVIEPPPDIFYAYYKVIVFYSDYYPVVVEWVNYVKQVFGTDNVTALNIWTDGKYSDAFYSIAQVISPPNEMIPFYPIYIILDEDKTLLSVFHHVGDFTNEDELYAIATLGKGYSGVYVPISLQNYNINPENFTLLTDQQKIQIRDTLQEIYPIRTNVD